MTNGSVRIDPTFASSRTYAGEQRKRHSARSVIAMIGIAAFAFGWIYGSASITADLPDDAAPPVTPSTAPAAPTTIPRSTATESPTAVASLDMALGAAVPGFSDTITLTIRTNSSVDIVQWHPSKAMPETLTRMPGDGLTSLGAADDESPPNALQSTDGRYLAELVGSPPEALRMRIVETATGVFATDVPVPGSSIDGLAWSPTATRLALAASPDGGGSQLFVVTPGDQHLGVGHRETEFGDPGLVEDLLWSEDGRFVIASIQYEMSMVETSALFILDTEHGYEISIPISGRPVDLEVGNAS
ncbi:MAG: WD40 repeat domain-containing protein [Actinomycetota bacterium]